jgi:hypothetical protein
MSDYFGAVSAIKQRLVEQWVDGGGNPKTLIVYVNHLPEEQFPPIDPATGNPAPFLVCEVAGTRSDPYTFGNVGNRFFIYDGLILLHVLVPLNEGTDRAQQMAVAAGEVFRTATIAIGSDGSYVRTIAPNPADGGSSADLEGVQAGNTFRVTVTVPFQFFMRA